MSKIITVKTKMTSEKHLIAAIAQLGYGAVEASLTPQPLRGYGFQQKTAHIRVSSRGIMATHNIGHMYGDVGFLREADGSYNVLVDDLDQAQLDRAAQNNGGTTWLSALKQAYTEQVKIDYAEQRGYSFQGREIVRTETGTQVVLLFDVPEEREAMYR